MALTQGIVNVIVVYAGKIDASFNTSYYCQMDNDLCHAAKITI